MPHQGLQLKGGTTKGAIVPGAPGEKEIAAFIADTVRNTGIEVEIHEPHPGRTSVLARLEGTGAGRSLMLNAHSDTVGVEGMAEPFSGAIRDGKLYGRGAYDMKGSLAACMAAFKALSDTGTKLRGDVLLAAVADEEYGSLGTAHLLTFVRPDAAIVTGPTALDTCLAHKGYLWIEVEIAGRAAHGSRFELGIDANLKMGLFLAELSKLERDLRSRPPIDWWVRPHCTPRCCREAAASARMPHHRRCRSSAVPYPAKLKLGQSRRSRQS